MAQFQVDQNHGGFIEKAFRINVAAQYPAFEQQFFESIRGAESKLAQKEKTAILSDVPTAPSSSNGLGQILTHIDISQKFFLACEDTFLVIATALDHQIIHTHRQRKPEEEFIPPAEYSVKTWPSIRSALRVYLKAPASNKQVAAVNVALVLFPEYQHWFRQRTPSNPDSSNPPSQGPVHVPMAPNNFQQADNGGPAFFSKAPGIVTGR